MIYYVSTTGNDSNNGTSQSTPWRTLAKVQSSMSLFQPGDEILFRAGQTFTGTLTINRSGVLNNPIKFGSYGTGNKPRFTGTGGTINHLFYMFNRSYIIFENLWITDPSIDPVNRTVPSKIRRAFTVDGSRSLNSFVTIKDCIIELVGVGAYFTTNSNTMTGCEVRNMRMVRNDSIANNDYGANGVVISSSTNTITKNTFNGCWANSFDYTFDGGAVEIFADVPLVQNNVISYNTIVDSNGALEIGGSTGGNTVNNTTIAYNKCINNGSGVYVNNSGSFGIIVQNVRLFNNVFVESQPYRLSSSSMFRFRSTPTLANSLVMRNNVVQLYGTIDVCRAQWGTAGALVNTNNVYKLGPGSVLNFTLGVNETITSGVIWQNTTSSNPLGWNYYPSTGSILINAGTNLGYTQDFDGNPISGNPDIGILEFSGTTTTTTSSTSTTTTTSSTTTTTTSTTSTTSTTTTANPISGTTYYVSNAGNDSNNGTSPSTPWLTLSKVQSSMSTFQPGDGILFRRGDTFSGTLSVNRSGTVTNPITFGAYGVGNKPKLIGTGSTISRLVYLFNRNYIVFDGLEITDPTMNPVQQGPGDVAKIQRGFQFDGTSAFNVIRNCNISLVGIGAFWVGPNNKMEYCLVENTRPVRSTPLTTNPDDDYGFNPLVISSSNNQVLFNTFKNCFGQIYDYGGWDSGAVEFFGPSVSDNLIFGNTIYRCGSVCEFGSSSGGTQQNNVFAYNKFIDNNYICYINNGGTFAVTAINNQFYNNVFVETYNGPTKGVHMISMRSSVTTPGILVFKNNVFDIRNGLNIARSGQWNGPQLTHTNNTYSFTGGGTTNFTLDPTESISPTNYWTATSGDPLTWNYTPLAGSVLINSGVNVGFTTDFAGNPIVGNPDRGILERP